MLMDFLGTTQGAPSGATSPARQAAAQASRQQFGKQGKFSSTQAQVDLAQALQPSAMQGLNFMNQLQPMQQNRVMGALAALNPANRQQAIEQFRRGAQAQGRQAVEQQLGALGPNANILAESLRIGAMNDANRAANEFMFQQLSPEQDVQAALLSSQLMSPEILSPALAEYMNLIQAMRAAHAAQPRKGTLIDSLTGIAGSMAGLGWNPF